MTDGFKSGPGDDPFADDGDDDDASADLDGSGVDASAGAEPERDAMSDLFDEDGGKADPDPSGGGEDLNLPWVLERGSVKDGRPKTMEFRMRPETAEQRRDFKADVERELGKDVYALDLREAAYLVAMNHPDEVADQLREWGYDYL